MLNEIFKVFSRRGENRSTPEYNVPKSTRLRLLRWVGDVYRAGIKDSFGREVGGGLLFQFWEELADRLDYRNPEVFGQLVRLGPEEACRRFLTHCSGPEFLDFVEDIFSASGFAINPDETRGAGSDDELVGQVNLLMAQDSLPYHLTPFVKEDITEEFQSRSIVTGTKVHVLPKIILKDAEVVHENAVAPVLSLLSSPRFLSANAEFLAALEDYRKGDLSDCLTKCGSAFESVSMVICQRKGWGCSGGETASVLIKKLLSNSSLEGYFESPLTVIATLRNKLSSAHGGGSSPRTPARHLAQYAINATASAILLVTHETGEY